MACGNSGDEGESGRTLNTLMVSDKKTGYSSVSIGTKSANDRTIISDLTVTIELTSTHGADATTTLWITHDTDFVPSMAVVGGGSTACSGSAGDYKCPLDKSYDPGDSITVHFYNTYVKKKDVSVPDKWFVYDAQIYSNWRNTGSTKIVDVYVCQNLGTVDCNGGCGAF